MSIELGSIASGIGNIAGSIGRAGLGIAERAGGAASVSGPSLDIAPAFGAAPPVANLGAEFGQVMRPADLGPIDSGGLKGGFMDLKNSVPLQPGMFNPAGEINFNKPVIENIANESFSASSVIEAAELIVSQSQNPLTGKGIVADEPTIIKEAAYWFSDIPGPRVVKPAEIIMPRVEPVAVPLVLPDILDYPKPEILVAPVLKPGIKTEHVLGIQPALQTKTASKTENMVSNIVEPAVSIQPELKEEETEEIIEEKVVKQEPKEILEEEDVKERKMIVEDGEVTAQRKFDIKIIAVKKAQELAIKLGLKKIPGRFIALFAPAEYPGVRSQIIKEQGPDGSYQETVEELTRVGEFESVTEAQGRVDQVIEEKKPGKQGKNGVKLAFEHVARIFKYRLLKPPQTYIEVVKRVAKKRLQQPQTFAAVAVKVSEKQPETNLEELSPALAEVFPKAA